MKKKIILGVVAGATVFGGVYGLAASLGLTSDTLGAGQTVVASCQSTPVRATYSPTYDATVPGYSSTTVTITGLAAGCLNKAYRVTLTDATNASLGEATGTTPTSGTSMAVTFTSVSATTIGGLAAVISG